MNKIFFIVLVNNGSTSQFTLEKIINKISFKYNFKSYTRSLNELWTKIQTSSEHLKTILYYHKTIINIKRNVCITVTMYEITYVLSCITFGLQ